MKEFYENNKEKINIILIVLAIILVVYLAWTLVLSKKIIFNKQVESVGQAGEKYFGNYANKLPTKEEDVTTVSVRELMEKSFILSSDLYIPKTKTSCDLDNSWVKAKMKNGKIEYYTYLKCGNYENDTDHEGPTIVLNGEKKVILDVGEVYKEAGIKSIKDNVDGNIDTSKIVIRNNDIDSSAPNTYEITYIAYDSLKNKAEVKREVQVVKKLETVIKERTNNINYYSGMHVDNFVQFSGMLWQIVGINSDDTIKLVSANPVANVVYGKEDNYEKTNIYKWLNDYFYNHLNSKKYVVKSKWCVGKVESSSDTGCNTSVDANVGLITLNEESKMRTDVVSYYNTNGMSTVFLANKKNNGESWVSFGGSIETMSTTTLAQVKPAINIKKDLYIKGGTGTEEDPYLLNDMEFGKSNSKLNERVSGEYVSYSNYLFRIIETDKKGTTMIMVSNITNNGEIINVEYQQNDSNYKYDNSKKGNIGYKIDKEVKNYLVDDKKILENEWTIDEFDANKTFDKFKTTKFTSKFSIPKTYDMFSGQSTEIKSWLIDTSKQEGNILMTGPGGKAFDMAEATYPDNGVRLVIKLNKQAMINDGNGMMNNPYSVK